MHDRQHSIDTAFGDITIREVDGSLMIIGHQLAAPNISVHLGTVGADTDTAVCINGVWMKDAYAAGQHRAKGAS